MTVAGFYFDGRSARRHTVTLELHGDVLHVSGDTVARNDALAALRIPAPLGDTPRQILFPDGARCEIPDRAGFDALLQPAGHGASWVAHLEARWTCAVASLLVTLALVAAAYFWGLPYAAKAAAERMPESVLVMMDGHFLKTFDGRLLEPSQLSRERQQAFVSRLRAMQWPDGAARPNRIYFRSAPHIGPNAFALPGGTVVLLDELVKLSDNDEQVIAVLTHEMGHVTERHALRQMLQASVVGLAMAWYVGDVSTILAAAPTALLETRYSRDFERRADDFAARTLALNGIAIDRLGDMLAKLEAAYADKKPGKKDGAQPEWLDYLSTHPATAERIRRLKGAH
jgi:Zn-dependent protease with chaperone function